MEPGGGPRQTRRYSNETRTLGLSITNTCSAHQDDSARPGLDNVTMIKHLLRIPLFSAVEPAFFFLLFNYSFINVADKHSRDTDVDSCRLQRTSCSEPKKKKKGRRWSLDRIRNQQSYGLGICNWLALASLSRQLLLKIAHWRALFDH